MDGDTGLQELLRVAFNCMGPIPPSPPSPPLPCTAAAEAFCHHSCRALPSLSAMARVKENTTGPPPTRSPLAAGLPTPQPPSP